MTLQTDSKTLTSSYIHSPRIRQDPDGTWHIHGYAETKDLLKEDLLQDGFAAEDVLASGLEPVLYQRGEAHRQQRAALAKHFSPSTVSQKYVSKMESAADAIIADLIKAKRINFKTLTTRMATVVMSDVVGLNPTDDMITRLDSMLHAPPELPKTALDRFFATLQGHYRRLRFWFYDVRPAVAERKKSPKEDVISYMISKGKGQIDILTECLVYGAAGMATTQEFICIVLMHVLENPEVRAALSVDDTAARYETLNEILRLEPVVGALKRKVIDPVTITSEGQSYHFPAGSKIKFHIYDANSDPQAISDEPTRLKPHRDMGKGVYRSLASFGAGPHRCAGEHIAIAETDIFIRKLMQVPGLRIEKPAEIRLNELVEGYEVINYTVVVD